jgi:hypothetical protein
VPRAEINGWRVANGGPDASWELCGAIIYSKQIGEAFWNGIGFK